MEEAVNGGMSLAAAYMEVDRPPVREHVNYSTYGRRTGHVPLYIN